MENCLPLRLTSNNLSMHRKMTKHLYGVALNSDLPTLVTLEFLAEAEACIDISSLPVVGTITVTSNLDLESEPQIFDVSGSFRCRERHWTIHLWVRSDEIEAGWGARFDSDGTLRLSPST